MTRKIIIFGNSGSGKSTLAKKLHAQHQLAHLDLDTLAWQESNLPTRKPLSESKQIIESFMRAHTAWVIEGCYVDLLQLVVEHANQAVFMNLPVSLCQQNANQRLWEPHKYVSKAAQDANLPMLLDWIAGYADRTDEFSYQAQVSLYNQFTRAKQQITKNQVPGQDMKFLYENP